MSHLDVQLERKTPPVLIRGLVGSSGGTHSVVITKVTGGTSINTSVDKNSDLILDTGADRIRRRYPNAQFRTVLEEFFIEVPPCVSE
jgi:hypothetical protein